MPSKPFPDDYAQRVNDELAASHSINDYYDKSLFLIRWIQQARLRIIRDMVAEAAGDRILEIGAGGGHVLKMFKQSHLTAVDVSSKFQEIARENLRGYDAQFFHGEVQNLGLPAESFDKIICTEVLEHVPEPEPVLREIGRLLKANGRAVITVPNDPMINRGKQLVRRTPIGWLIGDRLNWGGDKYHLHQWRPNEFESYLSRFLVVQRSQPAPFHGLPIHACFLAQRRAIG
jgi:ubiquinone/menaquinone biosynthesis C-methylase UbiE